MSLTSDLIETLKKSLKSNNFTYQDVADVLHLSEASIKRMFSEQHMSLKRLEKICDLLKMDFGELVHQMQRDSNYINKLSEEQEQQIVSDSKTLLVAISVLSKMTFEEMQNHLNFDDKKLLAILNKLEKLGFIILLSGNRIKLLVSQDFAWNPDGPIQNYFKNRIATEFLSSNFDADNEKMHFINVSLSYESNVIIQKEMGKLVKTLLKLENNDAHLPYNKRLGNSLLLAIRPWDLDEFIQYRKIIKLSQ